MAANYTGLTQRPGVQFIGGTQTQNVQIVGITTQPNGVYFEFQLPDKTATAANVKSSATGFASIIEALFDIDGVAGIEWTQEPTTGGQLADHLLITVASSSGASTALLDQPFDRLTQAHVASQVKTIQGNLDDAEAS